MSWALKEKNFWNVMSWMALAVLIVTLCINCAVKTIIPSINGDDGWIAAINYLPFSSYLPGKDYNYTYGPLGFIFQCQNIWPNKLLTGIFIGFEHLAVGWVLWLYRKTFPPVRFSIFAIALMAAQFTSHGDMRTPAGDEYVPIVMLLMLLSVSLISKDKWLILSSALAGVYASLLIFIKFDVGIEALLTIAAYILLSFLYKYKYPVKALAVLAGVFVICISLLCAVLFKTFDNFFRWTSSSLEIVHAYAEGWNENCPWLWCYYLALLFLVIYFLVVFKAAKKKEKLGYIGMSLLPSILLGCRHGFVIGNFWHFISFYKYALVVIALLFLYSLRKIDMALLMIPFFYFLFFVSALDRELNFSEVGNSKRFDSLKLSKKFLPEPLEGKMSRKTYDGIPANMMWCFANNLQYKPNPSLILNLACSRRLDKQMSRYFLSDYSPDYIFCEFLTPCNRHMFFENPETWRTLLDLYQVYNFDSQKQVLLISKKKETTLSSIKPVGTFMYREGQWYSVPPNDHILYCSFDFKLNLWGQIRQLFYKTSGVFLNVKFADGRIQTYRMMPIVSKNAIMINYLPEDLYMVEELFAHRAANHVIAFQLSGPGLQDYQFPIPGLLMQGQYKIIEREISNFILPPVVTAGDKDFFITDIVMRTSGTDRMTFLGHSNYVPRFNKRDGVVDLSLNVFENDKKTPAKALFVQIDQDRSPAAAAKILAPAGGSRFSSRQYMTAGFKIGLDVGSLKAGTHTLNLIIQSQKNGKFFCEPEMIKFITE